MDMGHSAASSGGGQQIHQSADILCESLIQPGNVRRLVEKFRRLGESTFNSSKKKYIFIRVSEITFFVKGNIVRWA